MPDADVVITFTYTRDSNKLTVRHEYAGEDATITKNEVVTAYEAGISESKIDKTGFTFSAVTWTPAGEATDLTKNEAGDAVSGTMPDADVVITFTYTRDSYDWTINHYEVGTTGPALATADTGSALFEATIELEDYIRSEANGNAITGFTYANKDEDIVIAVEGNTANIYYSRNNYTLAVTYVEVDADGDIVATITPRTATPQAYDEPYDVSAVNPDPAAYTFHSTDGTPTGMMPAHDVEVIHKYTRNSYNWTINHYELGTTTPALATADTGSAPFGATVELEDYIRSEAHGNAITGFTYANKDEDIVIAVEGNTANIYYARNSYGYVIHHVELGNETNVLAPDTAGTAAFGAVIDVTAAALTTIPYFTYDSDSGDITIAVVTDEVKNEATIYYRRATMPLMVTKLVEGVADEATLENLRFTFRLTGNGEDQTFSLGNGETSAPIQLALTQEYIIEEIGVTGGTGDYSTLTNWATAIDGVGFFEPIPGTRSVRVTINEEVNEITFTNTYVPPYVVPTTTSVTVNKAWINEGDDRFQPDAVTVALLRNGIQIQTTELSQANGWRYTFSGLALTDPTTGAPATYTVSELNVPTRYTAQVVPNGGNSFTIRNTLTNPNLNHVTIHYWYDAVGGTQAAADYDGDYANNSTFNVPSPVIAGWTADTLNVGGTSTQPLQEYNVVYTQNDYTLTVHYVYAGGGTARPDHVETLNAGDPYNVASPRIAGYRYSSAFATGVMPARDHEVTIVYRPLGADETDEPDDPGFETIDLYDTPLGIGAVATNVGDCFE